jgi:hypothetical protein
MTFLFYVPPVAGEAVVPVILAATAPPSTAFTLCPEYIFSRTSERKVVTTAEAGFRQTRQVDEIERRSWALQWVDASPDIIDRIEALYAETYGGVLPMTYTPPEETSAVNVRFGPDPLRIEYRGHRKVSVELNLVEVL